MFFENMYEFLHNDKYAAAYQKHLESSGAYQTSAKQGSAAVQAATDLNLAMEAALRKVVDSSHTKRIGRYGKMFAILDTVPTHKGIAGDDLQYSTAEMGYIRDRVRDQIQVDSTGENEEMIPGFKESVYQSGQSMVAVREGRRELTPSASAGSQSYYNKVTNKHETYNNPYGSRLARQMGVLSIQATDADLLKLMLAFVNKDLKIPMPVMTVHDALITTPETMHIYRNAYNNIAVPRAIPEIKQFGKRLDEAYEKAKDNVFNNILAGRNHIDIGRTGQYKVLGDYFNDLNDKLQSESYKKIFDKRHKKGQKGSGWESFVENTNEILKEATKLGWSYNSNYLTVNRPNFKALFNLAERNEKMSGAENQRTQFVNGFEPGVNRAYKALIDNKFIKKHGIAQMTTSGGGGSAIRNFKEFNPSDKKKEFPAQEEEKFTPSFKTNVKVSSFESRFGGKENSLSINNKEEYNQALKNADWSYLYSDAYNTYDSANKYFEQLFKAAKQFDPDLREWEKYESSLNDGYKPSVIFKRKDYAKSLKNK